MAFRADDILKVDRNPHQLVEAVLALIALEFVYGHSGVIPEIVILPLFTPESASMLKLSEIEIGSAATD